MATGKGGSNRHHSKGSNGPSRPRSVGGPARPISGNEQANLAIRNLVGSLLRTIDDDLSAADHHGGPAGELQELLLVELSGLSFLQSFDGLPASDGHDLAAAIGAELATRQTPVADCLLASLAMAGTERGLPEFEHSWKQRISEGGVEPRSLTLGSNRVVSAHLVSDISGGGTNIVLAIEHPLSTYTAVVFVDHRLRGIAKDAFIGPPFDEMLPMYTDMSDEVEIVDVTFHQAARRFVEAVQATREFGLDLLDDGYVEGMAQVRRRFEPLIEDAEKHEWRGTKPTRSSLASTSTDHRGRWEPPERDVDFKRVHVEGDPSAIPPNQYGKASLIIEQVTLRATGLLGPSFAQPALDLTIAIACTEPCPFDNTQISSWPSAIVWFLAEESDVFDPRTAGRRRDDLAAMLPMTRATYETKAKRIRAALGSVRGDWKVHFPRS